METASSKYDLKSLDSKLSGQIKSLDSKLSGQIQSLDSKLTWLYVAGIVIPALVTLYGIEKK